MWGHLVNPFLSLLPSHLSMCLTLCDPMDYTVHGILKTRILERVAIPFSSGSSPPRNRTRISCIAGGFFTSWATWELPYQRQWNSFHSPQLHTESASCLGNGHSLKDNLSDNLTCLPEPCLQWPITPPKFSRFLMATPCTCVCLIVLYLWDSKLQ